MARAKKLIKNPRTIQVTGISEDDYRYFQESKLKLGIESTADWFRIITRASSEGRLLLLDAPTRDVLVGASREEVLREARQTARRAARVVLFEEGFISSPEER